MMDVSSSFVANGRMVVTGNLATFNNEDECRTASKTEAERIANGLGGAVEECGTGFAVSVDGRHVAWVGWRS